MYKYFFQILFFFTLNSIAQVIDSTSNGIKIIPDSTFAIQDSLQINDSLLTEVKKDSIAPIYSSTLSDKYFIISKDDLLHNDYKYTGDFLRLFPFNFVKDLGFSGQPNETFLYGVGNNSISYLMDGLSINDRYSNSLNLNLIQSEDIDSIEIVPLPRGFLYGAYTNPVSVNFITNDFIIKQPYTKIRFYQGANRDMMFDGSFNAKVMNRLVASFNITNRILDETYQATDYSIWQGKFKIKYLLSNDVNIVASYIINDYKAGYSGGVDVDSIIASGRVVDDVLYSSLDNPPMFYPNGRLNTLTHLPRLRVLATPTSWLKTDASVFYLYNESEFNIDDKNYSESKTFGVNVKNNAQLNLLDFQVNLGYEKTKSSINYDLIPFFDSVYQNYFNNIDEKIFSVSGIASARLFDSTFIPSFFVKTTILNRSDLFGNNISNNSRLGFGYDFTYKINSSIILYIGTSAYDRVLYNEFGAKYKNDFINLNLMYFLNDHSSNLYYGGTFFEPYQLGNLRGLGFNFTLDFGKIFLDSRSSYYSSKSTQLNGVPDFQTQTGLYYKDVLFNNNLDLKTGFVFYYTGKNNVFTYENGLVEVPSSYKLDFILIGEIQKTAIVYFTWQNLLGNNYYITPYYPMPGRNIRFGVAWEMFN